MKLLWCSAILRSAESSNTPIKSAPISNVLRELRCGNNEFSHAATSIKAEIEAYGAPEVDYFMRQFAPSFALTLDELEL